MTIQPGDPNGIADHNNMRAAAAALAQQMGVTVVLPPVRALGDPGHVDDHNLLTAALAKIAAEGGSAPAVATGGTVTDYTGDGTNGVLGQAYRVHTFTASGTLDVSQGGECDYLVVGGAAGGNGSYGANGGNVAQGRTTLTAGPVAVTVGRGGDGVDSRGGSSSLGGVFAAVTTLAANPQSASGAGGTVADQKAGIVSTISGTSKVYAAAEIAGPPANSGSGAVSGGASAAGAVIVRYKVA